MPSSLPRREASATFAPCAASVARGRGADAAARAGDQGDAPLDCAHVLLPGRQWSECGCDGGTSSAGLRSKKPTGLSVKPAVVTGMIGQSSGRGT